MRVCVHRLIERCAKGALRVHAACVGEVAVLRKIGGGPPSKGHAVLVLCPRDLATVQGTHHCLSQEAQHEAIYR